MIDTIKLLNYGIFTKSSTGNFRENDSASPVGYYLRTEYLDLVRETATVPGRIGMVFGIKYIFHSGRKKQPVRYTCRISHPPITNPESGSTFTSIIEEKEGNADEINADFFEFEYDWEIREGTWCFEILDGEKTVLKKTFKILRSGENPL
ncbi:MAG: DUF3859 domain-containing protein [Desulfobulbales bacterium]